MAGTRGTNALRVMSAFALVGAALLAWDVLLLLDPDATPMGDLVMFNAGVLGITAVAVLAAIASGASERLLPALLVCASAAAAAGAFVPVMSGDSVEGEESNGFVFLVGGAALVGVLAGIGLRLPRGRPRPSLRR